LIPGDEIMLRKLILAQAIGLGMFAPAMAADSSRINEPPPEFGWTDFYAGVIVGGEWSNDRTATVTENVSSQSDLNGDIGGAVVTQGTGSVRSKSSRFSGGYQLGYNYQNNRWVFGVVSDVEELEGPSGTSSITNAGTVSGADEPYASTGTITSSKSLSYLGTLRGRVGWLVSPQILAFASGGLAYGGESATTTVSETLGYNDTPPFGTTGGFSRTRAGWTGGAGFEWMFMPRWSLSAEYLYYDLGHATYRLPRLKQYGDDGAALETVSAVQSTTRFDGNLVRFGIGYHF
jgi:outer membrane immunogenic protein